ncbi:hypothetical protein OB2597_19336 [Pseudooceanicola batsensis HTCC2597]|uniref:Uncharacterized protein n=1 Tax=Pseudooceanicola batsensis (strain ATCC BAA-863 / DSM 15984 / KCTC 12145 / HTCC2597) TaxID=252305 RepID=A3U0H7_PSEBH|nr:hypothetical protein [Pseudooceanicola batsensis]EAQ02268.1 hypothetical protein OB2597_19336 [Pseudooceanicola batsensis HTCC2597]
MKLTTTFLTGLGTLAIGTAVAAQTQQDIEAQEPADIEIPRGEVVEEVVPTPPEDAAQENSETAERGPEPDPSREMFDDMQAVIDSVRSKTAVPQDPLAHLETVAEVHILPVSDLEGTQDYHAQSLREVLRENREIIADIRSQIGLNIFAVRALESEGYAAEDVLTWETAGTDDVTIVVDDL